MSKRMKKIAPLVDATKTYPVKEALELAKKTASAKFDETVELHLKLGINATKGDQQIRGTVVLPFSFGRSKTVAAFVTSDKAKEAKEAGADVIFTENDVADLQKSGKINFEIAVAIPAMMKNIAPLARILGPKGLMPTPKNETIGPDLAKMIGELKKGKVNFKNDDTANVHQAIGKVSTDIEKLIANYEAIMEAIKKSKPESAKGTFIKKVTIATTMGPGIKVAV